MSFVIPDYADKTSIHMVHLNIDRIYTAINLHNCSQEDWYNYLCFVSHNDHGQTC